LERLLLSWSGRWLLALIAVLLFAGANTLEFRGLFASSRNPELLKMFNWQAFWLSQSIRWGLWTLVALLGIVPLMSLAARWSGGKQFAAHGVLALGAAWSVGLAWNSIRPELPKSIDFEQFIALRQGQREQMRTTPQEGGDDGTNTERRRPEDRRQGVRRGEERRPRSDRGPGRSFAGRDQSDGLLDRLLTHAFLLLLCGAGASYLRSQRNRRQTARLALEHASLAAELGEARLSALESQLRPHFLFNALHSVGALVGAKRNTEARTALVTLGDLLRVTLDRSTGGQSSLDEEADLCRSYLDLEQLRYGDRIVGRITIPADLKTKAVPPLILLPLMENCVRHVVNNTSEPIEIHLEATSDAEDLILDVTCSGGSFGDDILKLGQGQGIGLANTRARLAAAFGTRASMNLENLAQGDTPAGTRVRLRLPLNTQP
jgi:hypothetical protein